VQGGLTTASLRWAFATFHFGNWHPLTWLSLQLDATLHGTQHAAGFHVTNVLLHLASAVLLFLVLETMTRAPSRSALVAALFALHPLHVEPVAWVAERKGVLSTLFWMLTLAAYVAYVRRPSLHRYSLVFLALALGLMAKAMLVTLPFALLLLDYWPLRRWPAVGGRSLLREKVPLLLIVLALAVPAFLAQRKAGALPSFELVPLEARWRNALEAYAAYIGKMFWPLNLAPHYPHPGGTVSTAGALASGLLLALLTLLVLGPGRHWPYLAVGWLWYLGTLVPVIGLVQIGGHAMADRYTYVPLIGLYLALTWGAADLVSAWRLPRPVPIVATVLVLLVCIVLSWTQIGYWANDVLLWQHALAVTERNALAHCNLGVALLRAGLADRARIEFEKAVAVEPRYAQARLNLANALRELGRLREAEAQFRAVIELDPRDGLPHYGLGNALWDLGQTDEAMAEYRQTIDLDPTVALPHYSLGLALQRRGQGEEAETEYRRALEIDSTLAVAHHNLGGLLAESGRRGPALAELRLAAELDPALAAPHCQIGVLLQEDGRLVEAAAAYRKALALGDRSAGPRLLACEQALGLRPLPSR
jgi:tetratricopeptide (TPR) repeat protein